MTAGERRAELYEVRLLLRWAAATLTVEEQYAIWAELNDVPVRSAAVDAEVSHAAIFLWHQAALTKMRARLAEIGIYSAADVLQG